MIGLILSREKASVIIKLLSRNKESTKNKMNIDIKLVYFFLWQQFLTNWMNWLWGESIFKFISLNFANKHCAITLNPNLLIQIGKYRLYQMKILYFIHFKENSMKIGSSFILGHLLIVWRYLMLNLIFMLMLIKIKTLFP